MIVQGQDLPIHLGSLILATKAVSSFFADDTRPGDVMFHNDPAWDGSHIADWCMYKPVFVDDELLFWTVSKGHMADSGGPVPGSYNPEAREIFAEGLRIPPIKIYDEGRERSDVLNLLLANTRTRRNQAGDLRAQLGAVDVGAAHLTSAGRQVRRGRGAGLRRRVARPRRAADAPTPVRAARRDVHGQPARRGPRPRAWRPRDRCDRDDHRRHDASRADRAAADPLLHELVPSEHDQRRLPRADHVPPAGAAVQRGHVPADRDRLRPRRVARERRRAGPPRRLHDLSGRDDHRRRPRHV